MSDYSATYSPEDNKLRLYAATRLDKETYARVKAAGFRWAPKQDLFVAPMWTPDREDLLLELAGEIGDEDKTLAERQEERAERFEDYSDKRAQDADSARRAVSAIADNIPLGQPILVGHHSEKRARRDAEKIDNGMRRAVKMWDCSKYWEDRAASAIRHARYKELPSVRARRIKTIEADKRKRERAKAEAVRLTKFWKGECFATNKAGERRAIEIKEENRAFLCQLIGRMPACGVSVRGKDGQNFYSAWDILRPEGERYKNTPDKTVAELQEIALRLQAVVIARSERWIAHYDNRLTYERAMLDEDGGTVADKTGPEKGGGCKCWASRRGAWSWIQKVNKVSVTVLDNWGNAGQMDGQHNFTRNIPFDKLSAVMSPAEVKAARDAGELVELPDKTGFALRSDFRPKTPTPEATVHEPQPAPDKSKDFEAMRESVRAGVQVVAAPQLFPTPPELCERMADLAELTAGDRVLEPSAGTGNIVNAIIARGIFKDDLVAVEINQALSLRLVNPRIGSVVNADFLDMVGATDDAKFDKILMNPPFQNGSDIKHIEHARKFLNPGGRIVAICANGPRQNDKLKPLASFWEVLPAGTFAGTGVNAVLLTIDAPEAAPAEQKPTSVEEITEGRTIWNSDGTEGPCLICAPPEAPAIIEASIYGKRVVIDNNAATITQLQPELF